MPDDIETHHALLTALKDAQGRHDEAFERAVVSAFEHVFKHLERLNAVSDADGDERPLKAGESPTLR